MYGNLRRTDFLPVGEEKDTEVLERSPQSEGEDEEDEARRLIHGDNSDSEEEAYLRAEKPCHDFNEEHPVPDDSSEEDEEAYLDASIPRASTTTMEYDPDLD